MTIRFLDPTHEAGSADFAPTPRLATLEGKTVAVISNGKRSTKPFFDFVEAELRGRYRVGAVVRLTKQNYSAPVEAATLSEAVKAHAIITGVGD